MGVEERVKESVTGRRFPALVGNRNAHLKELSKPEEYKPDFIDYIAGIVGHYASRAYQKLSK